MQEASACTPIFKINYERDESLFGLPFQQKSEKFVMIVQAYMQLSVKVR